MYSGKFKTMLQRITISLLLAFIFFDLAHKFKLHSTNKHLNSAFASKIETGPFEASHYDRTANPWTARSYSGEGVRASILESSIVHKNEAGFRTSFKQNSIFESYTESAEQRALIHRLMSETLLRMFFSVGFSWYFYSALYRDFYQQIIT
jgi:predicted aminopeptidase